MYTPRSPPAEDASARLEGRPASPPFPERHWQLQAQPPSVYPEALPRLAFPHPPETGRRRPACRLESLVDDALADTAERLTVNDLLMLRATGKKMLRRVTECLHHVTQLNVDRLDLWARRLLLLESSRPEPLPASICDILRQDSGGGGGGGGKCSNVRRLVLVAGRAALQPSHPLFVELLLAHARTLQALVCEPSSPGGDGGTALRVGGEAERPDDLPAAASGWVVDVLRWGRFHELRQLQLEWSASGGADVRAFVAMAVALPALTDLRAFVPLEEKQSDALLDGAHTGMRCMDLPRAALGHSSLRKLRHYKALTSLRAGLGPNVEWDSAREALAGLPALQTLCIGLNDAAGEAAAEAGGAPPTLRAGMFPAPSLHTLEFGAGRGAVPPLAATAPLLERLRLSSWTELSALGETLAGCVLLRELRVDAASRLAPPGPEEEGVVGGLDVHALLAHLPRLEDFVLEARGVTAAHLLCLASEPRSDAAVASERQSNAAVASERQSNASLATGAPNDASERSSDASALAHRWLGQSAGKPTASSLGSLECGRLRVFRTRTADCPAGFYRRLAPALLARFPLLRELRLLLADDATYDDLNEDGEAQDALGDGGRGSAPEDGAATRRETGGATAAAAPRRHEALELLESPAAGEALLAGWRCPRLHTFETESLSNRGLRAWPGFVQACADTLEVVRTGSARTQRLDATMFAAAGTDDGHGDTCVMPMPMPLPRLNSIACRGFAPSAQVLLCAPAGTLVSADAADRLVPTAADGLGSAATVTTRGVFAPAQNVALSCANVVREDFARLGVLPRAALARVAKFKFELSVESDDVFHTLQGLLLRIVDCRAGEGRPSLCLVLPSSFAPYYAGAAMPLTAPMGSRITIEHS